jgi:uncharacterized protein YprB with RNaseH-like and TPR domain
LDSIQEQLATLRKRIARVDKKYLTQKPRPASLPRQDHKPGAYFVDEWLSGSVVQTPLGTHFETERLYPNHKPYGAMDIAALAELPDDLMTGITAGAIQPSSPEKWAFLDTETTGLAGGTGTYAFLIGVGRITQEGFLLKQFFMRSPAEEASLLHGLAEYLKQFETLVTYNGKAYDQPLLETRYRMARARSPFGAMQHFDLLFGARRLWKLRFDSCRLVDLEGHILGIQREGDLPGEMIPYVYFEYVRTQEASKVVPILHHNALDIVTLACLTGIVPWAFRSPEDAPLAHGAEMVGLGRWLCQAGQYAKAVVLFKKAVQKGLSDDLLFRTLWDIGRLEKRLGKMDAAVIAFTELAGCRNDFRLNAVEALAKYYEHQERNYSAALEWTSLALSLGSSHSLIRRKVRLDQKASKNRAVGRLL